MPNQHTSAGENARAVFAKRKKPSSEAVARLPRLGAALPDAVTAGFFVFAWFAPLAVDGLVRNLALVMLVEFLLIHATGFYSFFTLVLGGSRKQTVRILVGLTAFYLLFIVVWSLMFGEWWPVLVFAWLVVGKLRWLRLPAESRQRMFFPAIGIWAGSVVFYLLAVFLTLMLPVPRFGITPDIVPLLDMGGEGEWLERPQTVVAAGVAYFSLLALSKFWVSATVTQPAAES